MIKAWTEEAWDDYLYWQQNDRRVLKRVNQLLRDIERGGGGTGIGKPELLKDNFQGFWSRRIDTEHRLIYAIRDGQIFIIGCRYHYEPK